MKKCIYILFVMSSFSIYSQEIATDRPSAQTDNSYTLYHKAFQLESGIMYSFNDGGIQPFSMPNLLLRYGAFEKIEFRFSSDLLYNTSLNEFSINPIQLGTKIQILRKEAFQLSVLSMTTLDNSHQNTNIKIVGNNIISNKFSIGYTFGNYFSSNVNSLNYSIFLSNSFSKKISVFLEFYGLSQYQAPTDKHTINFDFGGSYKLSDIMQVDAYFGKGFNNELYFASAGFSYLFNKI